MIATEAREQAGTKTSTTAWKRVIASTVRPLGNRRRILIVGSGDLAKQVCQALLVQRKRPWDVIGFLGGEHSRVGKRLVNPRIIGTIDQLFEIVECHRVQTIAVCLEDRRAILPVQTLLDVKAMGLEVVDGHDLYEQASGRLSIDQLKPSALIFSSGFRRVAVIMGLKRLIDLMAAAIGLVLLLPLALIVAAVISLDSPGPIFYRQSRVGLHGQPYVMWKFRSMRQDAESEGACWAAEGDPRVTRVGRWLRKWRIDELPQLINVLKGDMSLVGPRPERPMFVQELRGFIPFYDVRHTVRPGITGWAQIRFRYGASAEDTHVKLQYDLYYVKNLSLSLDARILLETVRVVLIGEGAR
jgi:sugar transferase (PEP-CTERM system associated)